MKAVVLRTIVTVVTTAMLAVVLLNPVIHFTGPITVFAASTSYCESRASYGFWVVSTTSNLNVRSGPGTNYSCCGKLPGGTIIHGTGKESNGFLQIDTGMFDGQWVSKSYLKDAWFERRSVQVKTSGNNRLILRRGPGTGFSEITRIPNKTNLGTIYLTSGWDYVVYKSGNTVYTGWVSTQYLVKAR